MKYKLITAILTATIAGGTIALLPFKGANIQPQLDKIHNAEVTMEQASTVIGELLETDKDLQTKNKTLQTQIKTLQDNPTNGNGEGDSNINYQNTPSMNSLLGKGLSQTFTKAMSYTGYSDARTIYCYQTTYLLVHGYYSLQFYQKLINYYKYLSNNEFYDHDKNALRNNLEEINQRYYCMKQGYTNPGTGLGQMTDMLNGVQQEYNRATKANTIPASAQINVQDIKLPSNLQNQLNECFELYTNYCKNNDIANKMPPLLLRALVSNYSNILAFEYLEKYNEYIYNHPNLQARDVTPSQYKAQVDEYKRLCSTNCKALSRAITNLESKL